MIPADEEFPKGPSIDEDGTFNRSEEPAIPVSTPVRTTQPGGGGCGLLFLGGFFLLLALFLYTLFS